MGKGVYTVERQSPAPGQHSSPLQRCWRQPACSFPDAAGRRPGAPVQAFASAGWGRDDSKRRPLQASFGLSSPGTHWAAVLITKMQLMTVILYFSVFTRDQRVDGNGEQGNNAHQKPMLCAGPVLGPPPPRISPAPALRVGMVVPLLGREETGSERFSVSSKTTQLGRGRAAIQTQRLPDIFILNFKCCLCSNCSATSIVPTMIFIISLKNKPWKSSDSSSTQTTLARQLGRWRLCSCLCSRACAWS